MNGPRIGSLFSGYGGLDMGVQAVLGGDTVWHVEFDDAPSRILAHHYPGIPNHGDITTVNWDTVEPVDILTGGFPCQDLSLAGRRKGMRPGTRSGLWADYLKAIDALRPELAVIENVGGLLSGCAESEADSELGPCPRCADPKSGVRHAPNVRALGRVLLDLASIGYDTRWIALRAADAGAPHKRLRVFVLAYPSGIGRREGGAESAGLTRRFDDFVGSSATANAGGEALGLRPGLRSSEQGGIGRRRSDDDGLSASATDAAGRGRNRRAQTKVGVALERIAAPRSGRATRVAADTERFGGERRRGDSDVAGSTGTREGDSGQRERHGYASDDRGATALNWGHYAGAIARWEAALGRRAPNPTRPDGKANANRLNPVFVEWMMGLPEGWVTDPAIGLTRAQQLKALGNGVVPQQAALAVSTLLAAEEAAA